MEYDDDDENIRGNMKISAIGSLLGHCQLKQQESWLGEECCSGCKIQAN
jgi:hypothetical protein